jgi:uncharacterized membrane protein
MLQAPNIVAAAGSDLLDVVGTDTPEDAGESQQQTAPVTPETDTLVDSKAYQLRVKEMGYVQFIDPEIFLNLANEKDLVIRLFPKH